MWLQIIKTKLGETAWGKPHKTSAASCATWMIAGSLCIGAGWGGGEDLTCKSWKQNKKAKSRQTDNGIK